jgi:hypothetical protein
MTTCRQVRCQVKLSAREAAVLSESALAAIGGCRKKTPRGPSLKNGPMAKPYQVRQILKAIERLEADRDSSE